MWKITLRDIRSNFKRFLMSIFAVAIGVSFLTGTLSFRDHLSATFSNLNAALVNEGLTVYGAKADTENQSASGDVRGDIDPAVISKISALSEVEMVIPQRTSSVQTFDTKGASTNTYGAPSIVSAVVAEEDSKKIIKGELPKLGEVALEESTATRNGLAVGDELIFYLGEPIKKKISGIIKMGAAMAGASLTAIPEADYVKLFGANFQYATIKLVDNTNKEIVKKRIENIVPNSYSVKTDDEVKADLEKEFSTILTAVNTFLLTFVAIALGVSTFIIANTFLISIRQRQRQFALLRAMGSSQRQVFSVLIGQAVVIGSIGSIVGLLFGQGLFILIHTLLARFGMEMTGSLVISPQTALISFFVGLGVTILATLLPSRRAAHIAPIEAMRDSGGQHEKSVKIRGIIFTILILLALGMLFFGATKNIGWSLGFGAFLGVVSLVGIMPVLVKPVVAVLGWPIRKISRVTGVIACRSLSSLPRKTGITAVALAIGIMLVTAGSTVVASMQAQIEEQIDTNITADMLVISNGPVKDSTPSAKLIKKVSGVKSVDNSLSSGVSQLVAIDEKPIEPKIKFAGTLSVDALRKLGVKIVAGDAQKALAADEVIYCMDGSSADSASVKVGTQLTLGASAKPLKVKVGAIAKTGNVRLANVDLILPKNLAEKLQPMNKNASLLVVDIEKTAKIGEVKAAVQDKLKDQYIWQVLNRQDLKELVSGQFNTLLITLYALLALSVIIAVLGVVNTLSLSVIDRKKEIGLLRAVGMQRNGVREMLFWESILSTLLGAITGIAAGVVIGLAFFRYLVGTGTPTYELPWANFAWILLGALIVGAFASILPARKAGKTEVLAAIAED